MRHPRVVRPVILAILILGVASLSKTARSPHRITAPAQSQGLNFSTTTYNVSSGNEFVTNVALGDFNGDGYPDIAAADQVINDGNLEISLNQGDGTFGPFTAFPATGIPQSLVVADFDGDGALDIAVTDFYSGELGIFFGNGDGTFQPEVTYINGAGKPAVGDFNHDGKPDLVFAYGPNEVSVLLNKGGRKFGEPQTYPTGMQPAGVAVADMNNDGNQDLIVAEVYGGVHQDGAVGVLLGNGDGTFQAEGDFGILSFGNTALAVADFNGDGNLDVVTNGYTQNYELGVGSLITLRGRGNGGLIKPTVYRDVKGYVMQYVTADFNGDGNADLAAPDAAAGADIYLGTGKATFDPKVPIGTSNPVAYMTTGFLRNQGPGYADIVAAGPGTNVTVFLNQTAAK
jgi:hypothetical protein